MIIEMREFECGIVRNEARKVNIDVIIEIDCTVIHK